MTNVAKEQARMARNAGLREFKFWLEQIAALLKINMSCREIHELFSKSRKISMSYSAFCYHVRKINDYTAKPGSLRKPVPAPAIPSVKPLEQPISRKYIMPQPNPKAEEVI